VTEAKVQYVTRDIERFITDHSELVLLDRNGNVVDRITSSAQAAVIQEAIQKTFFKDV
jgi:glutathione peroxidase-family protein